MRSFVLLFSLLSATAHAMPTHALVASDLTPGEDATVTVSDLPPGARTILFVSARGTGLGPCAPGGSPCLDIMGPVVQLGSALPDPSGTATIDFAVPMQVADGTEVNFQAAIALPNAWVTSETASAIVGDVAPVCAVDAYDGMDLDSPITVDLIGGQYLTLSDLALGGDDTIDDYEIAADAGCIVTARFDTDGDEGAASLSEDGNALSFGDAYTWQAAAAETLSLGIALEDLDVCFDYDLELSMSCDGCDDDAFEPNDSASPYVLANDDATGHLWSLDITLSATEDTQDAFEFYVPGGCSFEFERLGPTDGASRVLTLPNGSSSNLGTANSSSIFSSSEGTYTLAYTADGAVDCQTITDTVRFSCSEGAGTCPDDADGTSAVDLTFSDDVASRTGLSLSGDDNTDEYDITVPDGCVLQVTANIDDLGGKMEFYFDENTGVEPDFHDVTTSTTASWNNNNNSAADITLTFYNWSGACVPYSFDAVLSCG